jgi:hypothetical protein
VTSYWYMALNMTAVVYSFNQIPFHMHTDTRTMSWWYYLSYEINHCPYRIAYEESHGYYILIWYLGRQEEKASEVGMWQSDFFYNILTDFTLRNKALFNSYEGFESAWIMWHIVALIEFLAERLLGTLPSRGAEWRGEQNCQTSSCRSDISR